MATCFSDDFRLCPACCRTSLDALLDSLPQNSSLHASSYPSLCAPPGLTQSAPRPVLFSEYEEKFKKLLVVRKTWALSWLFVPKNRLSCHDRVYLPLLVFGLKAFPWLIVRSNSSAYPKKFLIEPETSAVVSEPWTYNPV